MAECKYYEICGREADEDTMGQWCILHSKNIEKDENAFQEALREHRKDKEGKFHAFVFPEHADFRGDKFEDDADFFEAEFRKGADFSKAEFCKTASFRDAMFAGEAEFRGTNFAQRADWSGTTFNNGSATFNRAIFAGKARFMSATFHHAGAYFLNTEFGQDVDFRWATFFETVSFRPATFAGSADFSNATFYSAIRFQCSSFHEGATFDGTKFWGEVNFAGARFLGRTLFVAGEEDESRPIFRDREIDFTNVVIAPLDALVIRDADLQKCRFQGTDLRKAEITNATWPKITVRSFGITISTRNAVYDEIVLPKGESRLLTFLKSFSLFRTYQSRGETANKTDTQPWPHVERVYRELKQNYEDRRDYERANDFHYGEKEMRRKNPKTPWRLKFPLWLYWLVSGYGERCLRPMFWAAALLVVCVGFYVCFGLSPNKYGTSPLGLADLGTVFNYSVRVMTLLKPNDLFPIGCAQYVNTIQSIAGPILFGLFALALRQRLKR